MLFLPVIFAGVLVLGEWKQYYDLHGNEGLRTRLLTFWQMLAVAIGEMIVIAENNTKVKRHGIIAV